MFGGVAKSYIDWKIVDEPVRENGVYYVHVQHPKYKMQKKVRWYTDKEHAEMMPGFDIKTAPFWELFGFKSKEDKIKYIKECDLTQDEIETYFYFNWEKSDSKYHWRMGAFLEDKNNRGIWYAPFEAPDFPIGNKDCVKEVDWATFKNWGQAHCRAMGIAHSKYWDVED